MAVLRYGHSRSLACVHSFGARAFPQAA